MKKVYQILFVVFAVLVGTVAMANSSPILNSKANSFSIFNFQFSINFADGRKLRYEASTTLQPFEEYKTYSGNLVFDINDNLAYIIIPEGRILYNPYDSTFTYEYHLRDHLGSVRVAFTLPLGDGRGGAAVVQENTYYPFGSPINDFTWTAAATNRNIYLREGKEYIAMYGLNKYDFLNRAFDTWALITWQPDPMASMYYGVSPYALWANNPLRVIDPTGMVAEDGNGDWRDKLQQLLSFFGIGQKPESAEQARDFAERREALDNYNAQLEERFDEAQEVADFVPFAGAAWRMSEGMINDDNGAVAMGLGTAVVDAAGGGLAKAGVKAVAKKVGTNIGKQAAYSVYQGVDAAGTVRYIGITSRNPFVRFLEHLKSGTTRSALDYRVVNGATGLTRTQARTLEQTLINQYGMQKNGGLLLNKVNSIAPKYWWQYGITP